MLPYLAAMFLNAFVDLGHKIVIQNTVFKIYDGNKQVVLTAIVNACRPGSVVTVTWVSPSDATRTSRVRLDAAPAV